jgi:DNA primase
MEAVLCELGTTYKTSSGTSGVQLNIKECPNPHCGNTNWKVYLNAETGLGNCFSCNTGYNKWKFISFHEHMEGKDLYRRIGDIKKALGFTVHVKKKPIVSVATDDGDLLLPDSIELPTKDGQNAIYLENRGITGEYARYFRLRYCAEAWHRYTKLDGTQGGQNCSQRIIIPVYDLDARLVTFQARDVTGEAEVRYLFPAQLPGTGRYLYNGHNAYATGAKEVILNEGAFDVAATKRVIDRFEDMKGIVPIGSFGKHLSVSQTGGEDQLGAFMRLKGRGLERVTMMWDGEEEALSDALTAGEVLWKRLGLEVRIALLPAGKDPDEADQIEVYNAWADAFLLNARTLSFNRLRNPYRVKQAPLDLSVAQ